MPGQIVDVALPNVIECRELLLQLRRRRYLFVAYLNCVFLLPRSGYPLKSLFTGSHYVAMCPATILFLQTSRWLSGPMGLILMTLDSGHWIISRILIKVVYQHL